MVALALSLVALSAPAEAAGPVVDSCQDASYLDRTAPDADRLFLWDFPFAGDPERCIRIRVGQSVQWQGNFADHPLQTDEGDPNNPIANYEATAGLVKFDQVGVFGYRCNFHFAMRGAIQVVAAPPPPPVGWGGWPHALTLTAGATLLAAGHVALRRRRGESKHH